MNVSSFASCVAGLLSLVALLPARAEPPSATFRIRHSLQVKDVPADAKKVRIWFWVPDDDDCQKVLDLKLLTAPRGVSFPRDEKYGHRYLYAEVDAPKDSILLESEFLLNRKAVTVALDPDRAGELTETHRQLFAEFLRKDC